MRILRKTNLKLRLALRVAALSACCFAMAAAYVLFETDRAARSNADWIADIVARNLQIQQDRIHWGDIHFSKFPDLQDVATPLMSPGLCIAYRARNGDTLQRFCSGTPPDQAGAPKLFAILYWTLFNPGREIVRPIFFRDELQGDAVVTVDPGYLIAQAWRETARLLAVVAITLVCLCVLIYLALARALRPTQVIRAGLERLAANDFTTRLPPFDLAELSSIPDVFNHLAESLDRALSERNALTQRLIAVQDEERRHLARELHDEFGQCLAAISAVATSIGQTARQECPALLPECRIAQEAITNAAKHAEATRVRLRLQRHQSGAVVSSLDANAIELTVEDDGKGNNINVAAKSGMGLLGMRERVAALGGLLSFEPRSPAGLVLRAIIPAPLTRSHETDARCEA